MLHVKQCPAGESQGGKCEVQLQATLERAINSSCFYCACQVPPVSAGSTPCFFSSIRRDQQEFVSS